MSINKNKDNKSEELGKHPINQLLLKYSLPAIIASTATSIYNVIDRIFIGQGVGPLAISGMAITLPIMNLAIAFGTLVGAGTSALVSIRMGEGKIKEAAQLLGTALILNLFMGLIIPLLALPFLDDILIWFGATENNIPYARDFMQIILSANVITHIFFGLNNVMRASGYPTKAMVSSLLTVGINLILAPLFIFKFKWGIKGAATATVISQTIGLIWVLSHFIRKSSYIHFQKGCFKIELKNIKDIFSIGLAPFLMHSCFCLVTIIINWQLNKYGAELAVGAYGIINSVISLAAMIVFGLAQGMQPIVGFNYGAKQIERVTKALRNTILAASIVTVFGTLCAMLFPGLISRAFTTDSTLMAITTNGLRLTTIFFPLVGFQIITSNFFQYIGKAKISIFLSLSRQVIYLIPLLLILPNLFNLNGVWLATAGSDLLAAITSATVLYVSYKKFNKKMNL